METLYRVESIFELNPYDKDALERISPIYQDRVKNYINDRMRMWPFKGTPNDGSMYYQRRIKLSCNTGRGC